MQIYTSINLHSSLLHPVDDNNYYIISILVIEAVKLSGLNHQHILTPWCMTWDGSSPMFIYPYSSQGNLKQYLTILTKAGLSTHQIVKYGIQLLSAIGHMHKRKVIHKDIATRNC